MIEITIDVKTIGVFRRGERAEIERIRRKREDRVKKRPEGQTRLDKEVLKLQEKRQIQIL